MRKSNRIAWPWPERSPPAPGARGAQGLSHRVRVSRWRVWINPTGTPAMATGGTGDILTGLIAGFLAQFPRRPDKPSPPPSICTASPGRSARAMGEKCLIATDLLRYLPAAMEECAHISDGV